MLRLTSALYLERVWLEPTSKDIPVLSVTEQGYDSVEILVEPFSVEVDHVSIYSDTSQNVKNGQGSSRGDPASAATDAPPLSRSVATPTSPHEHIESDSSESHDSEGDACSRQDSKVSVKEDEPVVLPVIEQAHKVSDDGRTRQEVPQTLTTNGGSSNKSQPVPPLHTSQSTSSSPSNSLPQTPISMKPSMSQTKTTVKSKNFTGKLKRAFSVTKKNSM